MHSLEIMFTLFQRFAIVKPLNFKSWIWNRNNPALEVSLLAFLQLHGFHWRGKDWSLGGVLLHHLLTNLCLLLQVLELAHLIAGLSDNLGGTWDLKIDFFEDTLSGQKKIETVNNDLLENFLILNVLVCGRNSLTYKTVTTKSTKFTKGRVGSKISSKKELA